MFEVNSDQAEKFEFSFDGKIYELPSFKSIPFMRVLAWQRSTLNVSEEEKSLLNLEFFSDILRENAPEVIDLLSVDDFSSLCSAYINDSGVEQGE